MTEKESEMCAMLEATEGVTPDFIAEFRAVYALMQDDLHDLPNVKAINIVSKVMFMMARAKEAGAAEILSGFASEEGEAE